MENIKNILKKNSSVPLFLMQMDVKKKQEVNVRRITNKLLSYKVLITCLIFLLFSNTFALNSNFLEYSKNTNHAELNIMEGKLQEALLFYDSAFILFQQPLSKDIHNAIICSKKIKDEQMMKKYLDLMITTKTLHPNYYKKEGLSKYLSKEKKQEIKKKYSDKIRNEAYIFIQKLSKQDQAIRTSKNYTVNRHLINEVDSLTLKKYLNYFGDSFPGENLVINYPCTKREDFVLFWHWSQAGRDVMLLLKELVEELKFVNVDFAYLDEQRHGSQLYKSKYALVAQTSTKRKTTPINRSQEEIVEIDKNRAKIGLDSYDEYVKKIDFFKKNKEFCYETTYYLIFFE